MNQGDLFAELALYSIHPGSSSAEFVLEPKHVLDSCEIETELGREPLYEPEALDVRIRVQTRSTRSAPGPNEPLGLVEPKRLGMHLDELGSDGDHVARAVGHQRRTPCQPRCPAIPTATSVIPIGRPTICGQPPSAKTSS